MKDKLKDLIGRAVEHQTSVNWLLVHEVAKSIETYLDIEFSFVDGKERRDEPFGTNQGYISLKSKIAIEDFRQLILELADTFKEDKIALANLYILTCRLSYKADEDESILTELVNTFEMKLKHSLFEVLLYSLNDLYYREHRLFSEDPKSVEDWLSLFNSVDYLHTISNPVPQCLMLVVLDGNMGVDFLWVKKMNPLLRAVVVGQYGYDLNISETELSLSCHSENELLFIAACLLDDTGPDKESPKWISKNLIVAMMKQWELIGRQMFVHVFGTSYRNRNSNKAYAQLGTLMHDVLLDRLMTDEDKTKEWLGKLEFPGSFIAFFWWIRTKEIDISQIPQANTEKVATQFFDELSRILDAAPEYFADDQRSDPFMTYQLSEEKYGLALVYILFFLVYSSEDNIKRLKSICLRIKPFFYGAYQTRLFATRFTEVMLLIFLSAESISGIDEHAIKALKKYLKVISDTLLVPYIHLEERDDQIWNLESEKEVFAFNAGRHLVTNTIQRTRKHQVGEYYNDFFNSINEVAIAKWF